MIDSATEHEDAVVEKFEQLFPNYDYSNKLSHNEKDVRKRKRMKTMY